MTRPSRIFHWPWRKRATIERDVDAELRFHIDMRAAELGATGLGPADARLRAEQEFGDVDFTRRYCRDLDEGGERSARFADRLAELRQDVRFALRSLRGNPGFTTVSLVTLAIAIGANVAVFSVTSAVLLEPLPYREPSRLVALREQKRKSPEILSEISPADYLDYREQRRAFDDIAAMTPYGGALTWVSPTGEPTPLLALQVTANTFDVVGVRALHGRTFAAGEDLPDRRNVVVLSHALWTEVFHGDTAVIGTSLMLANVARTVVGVMPPGFTLGYREQLWVPTNLRPVLANVDRARKFHYLFGIARLKQGATPDDGARDLASTARDLEARYPDANTGHAVVAIPLHTAMVGDTRGAILILNAAAVLVLLIACANLANVSLARGIARRREIAVRIALGADASCGSSSRRACCSAAPAACWGWSSRRWVRGRCSRSIRGCSRPCTR